MTTDTPMRERIARALAKDLTGFECDWQVRVGLTDAVLDAMREATTEMVVAGVQFASPRGVWRAMVHAAKEGK